MYKWSDFNINFELPMKEDWEEENNTLEKEEVTAKAIDSVTNETIGEGNVEKEIPINNIIACECPKCTKKRKNDINTLMVNLLQESWFCKHCGFAGNLIQGSKIVPTENLFEPWVFNPTLHNYVYENNLSKLVLDNFSNKRISPQTLEYFKINQSNVYFPQPENYSMSIVYPYFMDNKLVNIVYAGKYRTSELGGLDTCFNFDNIETDHTYIVATELEVFSFYETEIKNVISLFGGNSFESFPLDKIQSGLLGFLSNIESRLNSVKKITLALPNSDRGNAIKDELLRRLGKERCWVVQPPENNYYWNDILVEYGKNKFLSLLETAKPIPVRGLFDIDDVEDKLDELYHKGLRKGFSTGFDTVDQFYTVVPGQWSIVTGIPGHGKSNFLDAVMVNLAKESDWSFGIFSPENQPIQRHFSSIMEKYFEAPFDIGKPGRISEEQLQEGKQWLKKHFSVILPHEDDNWSIDGVLELAKVLVYRKGMRGLVIDPWNELDHSRPNNQTETEYVSAVLTKIRQFARNFDVHVWLVAHPAKLYKDKDGKYPVPTPYDISGSAHYRNKADNAITVWRNVGHEDQSVADIHIQKIRFKEVGKVGLCSLRFDSLRGSFVDDIDQNKRRASLESGEVVPTDKLRVNLF